MNSKTMAALISGTKKGTHLWIPEEALQDSVPAAAAVASVADIGKALVEKKQVVQPETCSCSKDGVVQRFQGPEYTVDHDIKGYVLPAVSYSKYIGDKDTFNIWYDGIHYRIFGPGHLEIANREIKINNNILSPLHKKPSPHKLALQPLEQKLKDHTDSQTQHKRKRYEKQVAKHLDKDMKQSRKRKSSTASDPRPSKKPKLDPLPVRIEDCKSLLKETGYLSSKDAYTCKARKELDMVNMQSVRARNKNKMKMWRVTGVAMTPETKVAFDKLDKIISTSAACVRCSAPEAGLSAKKVFCKPCWKQTRRDEDVHFDEKSWQSNRIPVSESKRRQMITKYAWLNTYVPGEINDKFAFGKCLCCGHMSVSPLEPYVLWNKNKLSICNQCLESKRKSKTVVRKNKKPASKPKSSTAKSSKGAQAKPKSSNKGSPVQEDVEWSIDFL